VKRLGPRTGNWLSVQQGQLLLNATDPGTLRGRRDAAMLALLLGYGLTVGIGSAGYRTA